MLDQRKRIPIPCPDGREDCAVFHFRYEEIDETKFAYRTDQPECDWIDHRPTWCGDCYACADCGRKFEMTTSPWQPIKSVGDLPSIDGVYQFTAEYPDGVKELRQRYVDDSFRQMVGDQIREGRQRYTAWMSFPELY